MSETKLNYVRKWSGEESSLSDGDVVFNNPEGYMSSLIWDNRGKTEEFNNGDHNSGIYMFDKEEGWLILRYNCTVFYWESSKGERPSIGAEVANVKHIHMTTDDYSVDGECHDHARRYILTFTPKLQFQFWIGGPREDSNESLYTESILLLDGWVSTDGTLRFVHNMNHNEEAKKVLPDDSQKWKLPYSNVNDLSGWNEIQWGSRDLDQDTINLYNSASSLSHIGVVSQIDFDNSGWQVVLSDEEEEDQEKEEENLNTPKVTRENKKEEDWTEDPMYDDWNETREDPFDRNLYTKEEFNEYYGGLIQWNFMDPKKQFKRQIISKWIYDNIDYMRDTAIFHLMDELFKTFN